jgi:hypothetical protein
MITQDERVVPSVTSGGRAKTQDQGVERTADAVSPSLETLAALS